MNCKQNRDFFKTVNICENIGLTVAKKYAIMNSENFGQKNNRFGNIGTASKP